jgi:hypothetical protein
MVTHNRMRKISVVFMTHYYNLISSCRIGSYASEYKLFLRHAYGI